MLLPGALFVLTMAEPNLAAGLMPFYRAAWDLDPLMITVVFATYLFALVPSLLTLGRPGARSGWWWRIAAGTGCGAAADVMMTLSSSTWVACIARVGVGLSVGLVTGSLAGLILERRGERGRTAMATGTVFGSAIGVMVAAVFGQYLPGPSVLVYLVHAVLLVAFAVLVVRSRRSVPRATTAAPTPGASAAQMPASEPALVGYLSGCAAWVSAGLVGGLLPSYGAELLATRNLALLALPVTIYLLSAWAVQRLVARGKMPAEPVIAQTLIVAGVAVMALVPFVRELTMLIVGGMLAGLGQGLAYRSGLHIVSAGSEPGEHARLASRYAAVAYLSAGVATVGLGVVATLATMSIAVAVAASALTLIVLVTILLRRRWVRAGVDSPATRVGAFS